MFKTVQNLQKYQVLKCKNANKEISEIFLKVRKLSRGWFHIYSLKSCQTGKNRFRPILKLVDVSVSLKILQKIYGNDDENIIKAAF